MKRSKFGGEQIIAILKEHEAGVATAELCRGHGISTATFTAWRKKFGGMEASDAKKLRALPLRRSQPTPPTPRRHHRVGRHLGAYAAHAAWLEDHRGESNGAFGKCDRRHSGRLPRKLSARAAMSIVATGDDCGSAASCVAGTTGVKHNIPRYSCWRGLLDNGEPRCIAFGGLRVDDAIEEALLGVVKPGA